jgi:hypothetical protein
MRNGEPAFALRLRRRAGRPRSQGGDAWLGKVMWEVVRSKIFAGTVREYFDPEAMDGVALASLHPHLPRPVKLQEIRAGKAIS